MWQPGDVGLLALAPRRLRRRVAVGAAVDDGRHRGSEAAEDFGPRRRAALVFDRVVQQRGDGRVFVGAVLQHNGRRRQQVRDVRRTGQLASLLGVQRGGEGEGFGESR